jgi:zinc/manganese transport system permease protein
MFTGIMTNAWLAGSLVAVVAGVVGFFIVLRGATFAAHGVPLASFAGAAGASLVGVSSVVGLAVFSPVVALAIGFLGRRRRSDVATALVVAAMLGLGALFLSWTVEYASEIYALLFGEVLGVSGTEVWLSAALTGAAVLAVAALYRPLLLTSVAPEVAEARGIRAVRLELLFLVLMAIVTTLAVPVVGTLLMFTLMVGPPAAARALVRAPFAAMVGSVAVALVTVWVAIAAAYETTWPIGFFVGAMGAAWYVAGRAVAARRG